MRLAYADPPYPGMAHRYRGEEHHTEVNHSLLAAHLLEFDGYALSTSSPALADVLPLFPGARVAAWVKPFASFKPGISPAYAWEPVIFSPARSATREEDTVRDWVAANITLRRGLVGVKPPEFCRWLFELLGARPGDEFVDVFPGSRAVTRAWEYWEMDQRGEQLAWWGATE